ncbi:MAG: hypothetical protein R3F60_11190 [bacterium]
MSDATADALAEGGFALQGFAAAHTSTGGVQPLLWFQSEAFGPQTTITWEPVYAACTFQEDGSGAVTLRARACYAIEPGQRLRVTGEAGTGAVFNDGEPGLITLENDTDRVQQGGISLGGGPIASAPVFGSGGILSFDPQPVVLLSFSTIHGEVGQAMEATSGPGILLPLTSGEPPSITFDINDGFSWEEPGAQAVPAGSALAPLLNGPTP